MSTRLPTVANRHFLAPNHAGELLSHRRVLTEALVQPTARPTVCNRIVPAAAALPRVFSAAVNLLAN